MRIKAIALISAAFLVGTATAAPQQVEHAPTVEQCQADRAYWMSLVEEACES